MPPILSFFPRTKVVGAGVISLFPVLTLRSKNKAHDPTHGQKAVSEIVSVIAGPPWSSPLIQEE